MSRYIDADKLYNLREEIYRKENTITDRELLNDLLQRLTDDYNCNKPFEQTEEDRLVVRHILEDWEEVRHGKWEYNYPVCSVCKTLMPFDKDFAKKFFIFCPNCGSKMDGDEG